MAGTLYVVPTPIGNMGDVSKRVEEVLRSVDFVVCEDTRIGGKFLFLLDIKKELVSHHEHNKRQSAKYITNRLLMGESPSANRYLALPSYTRSEIFDSAGAYFCVRQN